MSRVVEITVEPYAEAQLLRYTTSVRLDGQRYTFRFYASKVDRLWYFDIEDAIYGVGLSVGVDLLFPYRYLGTALIPPGILWVADKGLDGSDPDLSAWTERRASLHYQEVVT